MSDLFYQVSRGSGRFVILKGDIEECSGSQKFNYDKALSFFVFGHGIDPKNAKSPLFSCRDLFSYIQGYFLGKDDDLVPASHLDGIKDVIKDKVGIEDKDVFIIEDISIDREDADNIKVLFWNLFKIIKKESKINFDSEDVVIYMYLDERTEDLIKSFNEWGCNHFIDSERNAIVLYA